ncbi:TetR/AcrR family transcriptional regulator [Streptomyces sp. NBC_01476]|uniref:TetR/AcrR family transcriptional regulator n=1 Tax=Streptomyces sp. NBC_01476 TaxID=2903881 RepID=UPI002E304EA7|nr:TetR/AcrR family transcriptional regulator [Streptomyces sp. NBC_01476]
MTGAGTVGGRKARSAETEAALKEAAKRVFARTGYLKAKITDITAEAGRAAGSFYSHFGSKEQLLEALLVDMLAAGDERVEESDHSPDFSDPAAVRWHVAAYWRFVSANRAVVTALYQAAMVDEHFSERLRLLLEPNLHDIADHLEHIRGSGGELPGDPLVVASAMTSLMSQFAFTWLLGSPPGRRELTEQEAVDTLTRFIVHGISGPAGAVPDRSATAAE